MMFMRLLRLLSLLLSAPFVMAAPAVTLKAGVFEPPRAAPALALVATDGKPFRLADYRGKVVILEFGYTHCPAVCPVTLAALAQARTQLGPLADRVQVVFVTVDPARDTAPHLADYLAHVDRSFIGLTGSEQQLGAVMTAYGITATKVPMAGSGGYAINHSSYLYFIDKRGMLRALMPFGRPAAEIAHDARMLLQEGGRD
jgi:protein SCO1/2